MINVLSNDIEYKTYCILWYVCRSSIIIGTIWKRHRNLHFSAFLFVPWPWIYRGLSSNQPADPFSARIKTVFFLNKSQESRKVACLACQRSHARSWTMFEVLGMSMECWKLKLSIFSWSVFSPFYFSRKMLEISFECYLRYPDWSGFNWILVLEKWIRVTVSVSHLFPFNGPLFHGHL